MALIDTAKMVVDLSLRGNFSRNLGKVSRDLNRFDSRIDRSQSRANQFGQHIGLGIRNLGKLAIVGASAMGTIAVASLKLAGDFEAQLNTINTIARETPAGLSKIGAQIRAIARETGTPLEELTKGYYDLLSAGIKAADAQTVLAAANRLAIGGLATTAETVDLLTTAINTYGFKASQASTIADIFAKAVERGKVTAAELAGAFSDIGPIAAASGIEIGEVAAAFARLTASGVPAAEAATQMRSAIVALTRKTPDLKKLEKQTHRNYLAIASKKGLVYALQLMRTDAKKAGIPLIELLGRVEGLNFTLATTGPNFDKYNKDLAAMRKATGTSAEQMAKREKGLNFQLERLRALAHDAGITIGSALLPKLTPLLEKLTAFVNLPSTQKGIADFGTAIAGLFSEANISAGVALLRDAFQTAKEVAPIVAESARATGAAVRLAVEAFKTLPKEVQALAIGALAVNKLTGGIVTTLAKGVFDQLFARGSSPANPMWVATVGGGLPGAPIPGGPPGGPPAGAITPAIGAGIIINKEELFGKTNEFLAKIYGADVNIHDDLLRSPGEIAGKLKPIIQASPDRIDASETARAAAAAAALLTQRHGEQQAGHPQGPGGERRQAVGVGDKETRIAVDKIPPKIEAGALSVAIAERETTRETTRGVTAIDAVKRATDVASGNIATGAGNIVGAIARNRPIITVGVHVQATQVTKTVTIQERYGPGNGSYGGGH
jgi:TP901 family phage tail tape measure protein